jgi:hypothetical protein
MNGLASTEHSHEEWHPLSYLGALIGSSAVALLQRTRDPTIVILSDANASRRRRHG